MRDLHKKKTKAESGNTSAFTRCWERRVNKGNQKEKISEKKEERGVRTTKGEKKLQKKDVVNKILLRQELKIRFP